MRNLKPIHKALLGAAALITLSAPLAFAGAEIGGGTNDPGIRPVLCDKDPARANLQALAILRSAKTQAAMTAVNAGPAAQRRALVNGLRRVSAQLLCAPTFEPTLFLRSVLRGLELEVSFGTPHGTSRLEHEAAANFLTKFYGFLENTVVPLDASFYIPSIPFFGCHGKPGCNLPVAEQDFLVRYEQYGQALLALIASESSALGSDRAEVLLVNQVTGWVAEDFAESIFNRSLEPARFQLVELRLLLDEHLTGASAFGSDRMAVLYAREILASLR